MASAYTICRSLLITLFISAAAAGLLLATLHIDFWLSFVITTALQLVGSYFFNIFYRSHIAYKNNEQSILQSKIFDNNGIELPCAYCSQKNLAPINFNSTNIFTCLKCEKENAVYVNITTAQRTKPLALDPFSVTAFDDNIEVVKNKILNE